jgi:hypothetical protein
VLRTVTVVARYAWMDQTKRGDSSEWLPDVKYHALLIIKLTDCLAQKTFLSECRFSRVICKARQDMKDGVVKRGYHMFGP